MSRAALKPSAALLAIVAVTSVAAVDPHMDPALVPGGCSACHLGHGESGSPMLPRAQADVCLSCHGSGARRDRSVREGLLAANTDPPLIASALEQPFGHPLTDGAFSRRQSGVVTCTSCHSPHRSARVPRAATPGKKLSTRDPTRFEFELCESCHGQEGVKTQNPLDISRLLSPSSRSYHPVEGPSLERSASVLPALSGSEISCTDCHDNSNANSARGPHGSAVRYLLRRGYTTLDGDEESAGAYALCYSCHEREAVLDSAVFPEHRRHVEELRASCASCHNAHGSIDNRALIRFGEETMISGVSASSFAGRLAFESSVPGSGACYLTCHGMDHAPEVYGAGAGSPRPGGPEGVRRPRRGRRPPRPPDP